MNKLEVTINFQEGHSPYHDESGEKRLDVTTSGSLYLEEGLFSLVREAPTLVVVEVDVPESPCRFLEQLNNRPFACYWGCFMEDEPSYMEDYHDGAAPEIVCLHCEHYAGAREERRWLHQALQLNHEGYTDLLPELDEDEAPLGTRYVDHQSGEVKIYE